MKSIILLAFFCLLALAGCDASQNSRTGAESMVLTGVWEVEPYGEVGDFWAFGQDKSIVIHSEAWEEKYAKGTFVTKPKMQELDIISSVDALFCIYERLDEKRIRVAIGSNARPSSFNNGYLLLTKIADDPSQLEAVVASAKNEGKEKPATKVAAKLTPTPQTKAIPGKKE